MSKAEVKLGDNIWINFFKGALNVMGKSEAEVHGDGNRLYYGYGIEFGQVSRAVNTVPFVKLEDLKKLFSILNLAVSLLLPMSNGISYFWNLFFK